MEDPDRAAAKRRIPELVRELEASPAGQRLRDLEARRRRLHDALSQHPDPILREIGQQLVDGRIRPAELLRSSVYAEALQQAAARAAERLDPVALARELEALVGPHRPPADHATEGLR